MNLTDILSLLVAGTTSPGRSESGGMERALATGLRRSLSPMPFVPEAGDITLRALANLYLGRNPVTAEKERAVQQLGQLGADIGQTAAGLVRSVEDAKYQLDKRAAEAAGVPPPTPPARRAAEEGKKTPAKAAANEPAPEPVRAEAPTSRTVVPPQEGLARVGAWAATPAAAAGMGLVGTEAPGPAATGTGLPGTTWAPASYSGHVIEEAAQSPLGAVGLILQDQYGVTDPTGDFASFYNDRAYALNNAYSLLLGEPGTTYGYSDQALAFMQGYIDMMEGRAGNYPEEINRYLNQFDAQIEQALLNPESEIYQELHALSQQQGNDIYWNTLLEPALVVGGATPLERKGAEARFKKALASYETARLQAVKEGRELTFAEHLANAGFADLIRR